MELRSYQRDIVDQVMATDSHDLVQLDTGAGKTPILAELARCSPAFIALAHRNVLISQISEKLAQFGICHNTVSTRYTRRRCIMAHRAIGAELVDESVTDGHVASVDSLLARHKRGLLSLEPMREWWVLIDEAHHALSDNKWGLLTRVLPHARFIGLTATPARLDGRGLNAETDGLFERLVQSRELGDNSVNVLIQRGHLSDFRAYSPMLSRAEAETMRFDPLRVFGDVLTHFLRLARYRQTVVMCPRIENADLTAEAFRDAGICAAHVSSRMTQTEVTRRIEAFREHRVQVLCNVDILGEGYDFPGIEAVIMLRKTASLVLYRQWIGRALRPLPWKEDAVIIDHMGNVLEHGMLDAPINWSLDRIESSRFNQLIACAECAFTFPATNLMCPECGEVVDAAERRRTMQGWPLDQVCVDWGLVEMERQRVRRDLARQEYEARLAQEIVFPSGVHFGGGAVGQMCERLRAWFAEQLRATTPVSEINAFLHHRDGRDPNFYIRHFTVADTREDNPQKAKRILRQWYRSRS